MGNFAAILACGNSCSRNSSSDKSLPRIGLRSWEYTNSIIFSRQSSTLSGLGWARSPVRGLPNPEPDPVEVGLRGDVGLVLSVSLFTTVFCFPWVSIQSEHLPRRATPPDSHYEMWIQQMNIPWISLHWMTCLGFHSHHHLRIQVTLL